jgi:agmatinase
MEGVMEEAIQIAKASAQRLYVTVCSDIFDAAYNPGGPADFNGVLPHELFHALFTLGASGIDGFDYVEVYPIQDPSSFSSHLAAWSLIYALAGLASRKKSAKTGKEILTES